MTSENLKQQIKNDIIKCLDNIDKQSQNDKIKTLTHLLDKYIHLSTSDYLMDNWDLSSIIGTAKQNYANDNVQIHLGKRKIKVQQQDVANLFVIEATISHLNKKDCLKKMPKFDKRENLLPED